MFVRVCALSATRRFVCSKLAQTPPPTLLESGYSNQLTFYYCVSCMCVCVCSQINPIVRFGMCLRGTRTQTRTHTHALAETHASLRGYRVHEHKKEERMGGILCRRDVCVCVCMCVRMRVLVRDSVREYAATYNNIFCWV